MPNKLHIHAVTLNAIRPLCDHIYEVAMPADIPNVYEIVVTFEGKNDERFYVMTFQPQAVALAIAPTCYDEHRRNVEACDNLEDANALLDVGWAVDVYIPSTDKHSIQPYLSINSHNWLPAEML